MFQKKSSPIRNYQDETILNSILWFVENYLPQKKKRLLHSESPLDKVEAITNNKLKMLTFSRSKSFRGDLNNAKVTFTVGNWALPYLNFLKRTKLIK
tara:strand:+ start:582 stop:872 length:291 start_codon:yes stop_codon:yes gene_type:complete